MQATVATSIVRQSRSQLAMLLSSRRYTPPCPTLTSSLPASRFPLPAPRLSWRTRSLRGGLAYSSTTAAVTEKIGGRYWVATSQLRPASALAKRVPPAVPK